MAEDIIAILIDAGATDEEIQIVRKILGLLREGRITALEAYYFIMGLARENLIPLTPAHVGRLRTALGLPKQLHRLYRL